MNAIELLPKEIEVNDKIYGLRMHITAWGKICLCYSNELKLGDIILSQVVESEMTTEPEFSGCMEDIVDVPDLDSAVLVMQKRLIDGLANKAIKIYKP